MNYSESITGVLQGDAMLRDAMKDTREFRKVYQEGKSYANKYLVMYIRKNDGDRNQIGISVSKKVGNSVIRHRVTRLIREAYRLNSDKITIGIDMIIVARSDARERNYSEIASAFLHLSRLHGILKEMIVS